MQTRDQQLSNILPTPLVFTSGYANTGKTFSIAFIKLTFSRNNAKLFVTVQIKRKKFSPVARSYFAKKYFPITDFYLGGALIE